MDLISIGIIGSWLVSIPARFALGVRLVWLGLARRYPVLVVWLAGTAVQSAVLAWLYWTGGRARYAAAWSWTSWVVAVCDFALMIEAFVFFGQHFRNFRYFGSLLLLILFGVSGALVVMVWDVGVSDWPGLWVSGLLRNLQLFALLALAGARLFFLQFGWAKFRRNAQPYLGGLMLVFLGHVLGNAIVRASHGEYWIAAVGQFALQVLPLAGIGYWCFGITKDGDRWDAPPPPTPEQIEEAEAGMRAIAGR